MDKQNIAYSHVQLGEADLATDPTKEELGRLETALEEIGFQLIDDKKRRIIEKIKNIIVKQVHHSKEKSKYNLSEVLSEQLHYDYNYLSNLFSEVENITIEKYIIHQRIERVKELLVYDELSLSEIADQVGYSSAAHMANQFKKITGLTPGYFKKIKDNKRKPLDEV